MKLFNRGFVIYFAGGVLGVSICNLLSDEYWTAGAYFLISVIIYTFADHNTRDRK